MTIHVNKLIEFLAKLCENRKIMAATTESLKGGVITGISATLGGLLLGPVGLAIGAAIGGVGSAVAANGKFKPVAFILRDMSQLEKKRMTDSLVAAFRDFGVDDVASLSMLLMSSTSMQDMAIKQLTSYLTQQMNMRIQSG